MLEEVLSERGLEPSFHVHALKLWSIASHQISLNKLQSLEEEEED